MPPATRTLPPVSKVAVCACSGFARLVVGRPGRGADPLGWRPRSTRCRSTTSRRRPPAIARWEARPTAAGSRCRPPALPGLSVPADGNITVDPLAGDREDDCAQTAALTCPPFPPVISTLPFASFVAVWPSRAGRQVHRRRPCRVARIEELVRQHRARAARVAAGHQHPVAEVRRCRRCSAASRCGSGGAPCWWPRPSSVPAPDAARVVDGGATDRWSCSVCPPATSTLPFGSSVAVCRWRATPIDRGDTDCPRSGAGARHRCRAGP